MKPTSIIILTALGLMACGEEPKDETRIEGTEPGDCTDFADNDADGLFDCDDDGCAGSPLCNGEDTEDTGSTEDTDSTDTDTNDTEDTSDTDVSGNTPPEIDEAFVGPNPATVEDTLVCIEGTVTDDGGASNVSLAYRWFVNGVPNGESGSTLLGSLVSKGQSIKCRITPNDGFVDGDSVESSTLVISNALPSVQTASITPAAPSASDTLLCAGSGFSDPDGDPDLSTFEWLVDGNVVGTGATLSSGFSSGDGVTCRITPNDGEDSGTAVSTTVVIANTAPSMASALITPNPAYQSDVLSCQGIGFNDPDGDSDQSTYQWLVNGSVVGTNTVLASGFTTGDSVSCSITPFDGISTGTTVVDSITISNAPPVVASAALTPSNPTETSTLTCTPGITTDADGGGNFVYAYTWEVNGTTIGVTSNTLTGIDFNKNDAISCFVSATDGSGVYGTPVQSNTVQVGNTAPSIGSASVSPSNPSVNDTLMCSWNSYTDVDGDADQSTVLWTVNGTIIGTGTTLATGFSGGDTVTCEVTPFDGTDTGVVQTDSVTITNTAPSISSVSITPNAPSSADTLTCTWSGFLDPEGDSDQSLVSWYVNGNIAGSGNSLSGVFSGGDTVTCEVTPSDGNAAGTPLSTTVSISNSAPSIGSVVLQPGNATTSDDLTCTPQQVVDADGTTSFTFTYAWKLNGQSISETSNILASSEFSKGQSVLCTAIASDGMNDSVPAQSNSVVIANTIPSIQSVAISPSAPQAGDILTCSHTGFTDADNDADLTTYTWSVNGGLVGTGSTLSTNLTQGDTIQCSATPFDGQDNGQAVSSVTTVGNTAPVLTSVSLSPSNPVETSTLTCTPGNATDADGDSVSFNYMWNVGGIPVSGGNTLSGSQFDRLDDVYCSVTPYDGSSNGNPVDSNTVTVQNSVPSLSNISVTPTAPVVGDTLTCAWSGYNDLDGDADQSYAQWTVGGTVIGIGATINSGFTGGDTVTCSAIPFDGIDEGTALVSSVTVTGPQNGLPVISSLNLTPTTVRTNTNMSVSVQVSDPDGDAVTLTYDWTVDGQSVLSGVGETSLSGATHFDKGQTVQVSVTPNDGTSNGVVVSSSPILVLNTLPSQPSISLAPSNPSENDDIVCTVDVESTDTDNDPLTYNFSWEVDGVTWSGNQTDNGLTSTISAADINVTERWTCIVTPNDGENNGPIAMGNVDVLGVSTDRWPSIVYSLEDEGDVYLQGVSASDYAGFVVKNAGDLDGDGLDDVVVSAPGSTSVTNSRGKVYVFFASSIGSNGLLNLGNADWVLNGELTGADCKTRMNNYYYPSYSSSRRGCYTRSGYRELCNCPPSQYPSHYNYRSSNTGFSIDTIPDLNGDGKPELLIGSPKWEEPTSFGGYNDNHIDPNPNLGTAYLVKSNLLGANGGSIDLYNNSGVVTFTSEAARDQLGYAVSSAGDVDGDGKGDLMMSSPYNGSSDTGKVYLFFGSALTNATGSLSVTNASYTFTGNANDELGFALSSPGDVDGDGLSDILIGTPSRDTGGSNSGSSFLFFGSSLWQGSGSLNVNQADYEFVGESANHKSGWSLAPVGDVDGDTLDDIMIGKMGGGSKAYLVSSGSLSPAGGTFYLANANWTFTGSGLGGVSHNWISSAGDMDDDGLDDLLFGASSNSDMTSSAGMSYLLYANSLPSSGNVELQYEDFGFAGHDASDCSGYSVAGGGDIDGDGYADLIFGTPYDDNGGTDSGSTYIMYGSSLYINGYDLDLSYADAQFTGESTGDQAGYTVSDAGDVDGDGLADFIVSAPLYGSNDVGRTYLVYGVNAATTGLASADVIFTGESTEDTSGFSIDSAGDIDNDGLDDLIIGAPYNSEAGALAGKAYVIFGSSLNGISSLSLVDADVHLLGEAAYDYAGYSVAGIGDVDGDGLDDVMVGAPYNDLGGINMGQTYIVLGSTLTASAEVPLADSDYFFLGENNVDFVGFQVAHAGDVDGDGLGDMLITANGNDDGGNNAGKVYLVMGADLPGVGSTIYLSTAHASFIGENANDQAGFSISTAGDVDDDGLDDIIIGAYGNDDNGSNAGKSYVMFASTMQTGGSFDLSLADHSFTGKTANDFSGYSVSGAGDVDGDGYDDILIGAYGNDEWLSESGKTYLVFGWNVTTGGTNFDFAVRDYDYAFQGGSTGYYAGASVAGVGDVDGDGFDDVVIGAYGWSSERGGAYLYLSPQQ